MSFRRFLVPVALAITLLLQFVPGTIFAPSPVAAASTNYDFIANACSASWSSGACPGIVANPQLENGAASSRPGLVVTPQAVTGGYIQAVFPAYTVQAGDHFQSIVNCAYNAPNCYVNFRLMYQIGSGSVHTFWSFNERFDGLYYHAYLNLSSLAGQSVNFILYVADVSGHGVPSGDRAEWVDTKITNGTGGGSYYPPYPSSACNRGYFVGDVTIPDGSTLAPGQAFTKTWQIRNVGSCNWTTSYGLVYVFGDPMGASSPVYLPAMVAPGATADFSVNMVAPSVAGHYRSYWRFRDGSGAQFGVGSGMITFFADIYVSSTSGPTATTTTITSHTPNPSTPGQSVAVSVTVSGAGGTPTGTVAITGADTNCTISLVSGSGTCNAVFSTVGPKTLTATYSGGGSYTGSAGTASHTVALPLPPTTTSITSDAPDPSLPGQTVVVGVTVSGTGATPTGTVAITGADTNCTITLSGGSGTCNVVFTTGGTRTLSATYSGDATHAGSSDTEGHTVTSPLPATTTSITSDNPDPSIPGQVVSVVVSVTGTGTTPTGTVAITGADTNCTITLAGGSGSCNVIFNMIGPKTLTATYSGNVNYAGSSDTESHTVVVGQAVSATNITSNVPNPSIPGQAVVVSVTVSGAGLPVPTGTVNITGADTNCSMLLSGGSNSCSVVFNTTGHRILTATYSGDNNYAPSSGTASQTVTKGSTTLTINSDNPDPSTPNQPVAVNFTVNGAGVTPTGTVQITGADIGCTAALSGGSGSCNVVFNTIGSHPITATYSGDSNYLGSTITETHVVKNLSTTVITSTTPDPSVPGGSVLVSVQVSGPGVPPTGTVAITGGSGCTTAALAPNGPSSAIASCSVTFTTAGAKTLTATFPEDANYVGSTGSASHVVDKGPTTTAVTVALHSAPFASVTVSATVTPVAPGVIAPTGTVGISVSGVPSATCTITLSGGTGNCSIAFPTAGSFTVTGTYNGDGNYSGSADTQPHIVP